MQTLRNQPVRDTYAAFHFVSLARTGKKFQTVKLGFSSCVLHAGNVISSRYPHVTSFVGDSQQFPRICTLSYLYTREGVRDMMRRVRSRFICVFLCTNSHTCTMYFSQPLARSYSKALFEETRF